MQLGFPYKYLNCPSYIANHYLLPLATFHTNHHSGNLASTHNLELKVSPLTLSQSANVDFLCLLHTWPPQFLNEGVKILLLWQSVQWKNNWVILTTFLGCDVGMPLRASLLIRLVSFFSEDILDYIPGISTTTKELSLQGKWSVRSKQTDVLIYRLSEGKWLNYTLT